MGDFMCISSINNEKIKQIAKLNIKKYRDINNLFIIEGEHSILEAFNKGYLKEIYCLEGVLPINIEVPITIVSKTVMNYIYKMPSPPKYIGVVQKLKEKRIGNKVLMLNNVQDSGNLGTIIRSAAAFNFDTIILDEGSVDLYNEKVLRATEGMVFNVNVIRKNPSIIIDELNNDNYQIYGTDVNNGINIKEIKNKGKIAIIIGNEGRGISEEIKKKIDKNIYIPLNRNCESLNAGVAASIIMYEVGL